MIANSRCSWVKPVSLDAKDRAWQKAVVNASREINLGSNLDCIHFISLVPPSPRQAAGPKGAGGCSRFHDSIWFDDKPYHQKAFHVEPWNGSKWEITIR